MRLVKILAASTGLLTTFLVYSGPKKEIRSYDYDSAHIKEFRDRGNIVRIEVKPKLGPEYTLHNQTGKMPTMLDQDYVGQNLDLPIIKLKKW